MARLIESLRSDKGAIILVGHGRQLAEYVLDNGPVLSGEYSATAGDGVEGSDSVNNGEREMREGLAYRVGPKGRVKRILSVDEATVRCHLLT